MSGYNPFLHRDFYEALAAIRSAHRKRVLACHPDHDSSIAAAYEFHLVQQVYKLLSVSDESERERRLQALIYSERERRLQALIYKENEDKKKRWEARYLLTGQKYGQKYRLGDNTAQLPG